MSIARKIADRLDNSGELRSYSNVDAVTGNAVDIFIYDTSKDSDGGAWRKRTQATSWYNEAASSTRGSRKDFPAVAVIVAEASKVTIYDGDTPDLDMWMVFNRSTVGWPSTNSIILFGNGQTNTATAVVMLNGTFIVGAEDSASSNPYTSVLNFLTEKVVCHGGASYTISNNIADRNSTIYGTVQLAPVLVNKFVNDVAMTVLPNAPIDSATGLPTPTIAVATDGGC